MILSELWPLPGVWTLFSSKGKVCVDIVVFQSVVLPWSLFHSCVSNRSRCTVPAITAESMFLAVICRPQHHVGLASLLSMQVQHKAVVG